MTRLVALTWFGNEATVVRATWRGGRFEDVRIDRTPASEPAALAAACEPGTTVAIVLPSSETGRRIMTLPFRRERLLDEVVALETRGALPVDPGPLRVAWERLPDAAGSSRLAVTFARAETCETLQAMVVRAGATIARIDGAPTPVWSLVPERRHTALVVREGAASWITACDDVGRPHLARPLHADPGHPDAVAAEVAHTIAAWQIRPSRLLLVGGGTGAWRAPLGRACDLPCEPLPSPPGLGDVVDTAPVLAGALVTVAGREELPLALLAPAVVPRRQRRRLLGLVAAALLLAVLHGTLIRTSLAQRAAGLDAAIATVVARALPDPATASYEALEAAATTLTVPGTTDPALVRLHEVASHLPPGVPLDLGHLRLEADRIHLGGRVPTFDAVESLRRALAASQRLTDVRVADMRARLGGDGVEFQLEGRWLRRGEQPS